MIIEKLKGLRKKAFTTLFITGFLVIVCVIFGLILKKQFIFYIAFFVLVVGIIVISVFSSEYKKIFKTNFVAESLKSVFDNLQYNPDAGIDESLIKSTGMIRMGNMYHANDYISGSYHNVSFVQSDIKIQDEHIHYDSDGHAHSEIENIFVGRWMIFDFNKRFSANVQVRTKNFYNSKLKIDKGESKYEEVKMEDDLFNKEFKIYAQNEHDAFYILTPHFMEKLKDVTDTLNTRIMFCFIDNKLHIAINNSKDAFEYSIFSKVDESTIKDYVFKEIDVIVNFVEKLSLESDIFIVEDK